MTKQPFWNKYEAAILLEAVTNVARGKECRKDAIIRVSKELRKMAIHQNINIDEKYRNTSGISFQFESMENAAFGIIGSTNQVGSVLFKKVVDLSNNSPNEYEELLKQAKKMVRSNSIDFEQSVVSYEKTGCSNNERSEKENNTKDERQIISQIQDATMIDSEKSKSVIVKVNKYMESIEHIINERISYTYSLSSKEAVYDVKKTELKAAEDELSQIEDEHNRLLDEDKALKEGFQNIENQLLECGKKISEYEELNKSLFEELNQTFVFSFAKKNRLRSQIESTEIKINSEKQIQKTLLEEKKAIKEKENVVAIEALEKRIGRIKEKISLTSKELDLLKESIAQIENKIRDIDISLEKAKSENELNNRIEAEVLQENNETLEISKEDTIESTVDPEIKIIDTDDSERNDRTEQIQAFINDQHNIVYDAILLLKSEEECWNFFGELLSQSELQKVEQRAMIAFYIINGRTFNEIAEKVGVSLAAINRVYQMLQERSQVRKILAYQHIPNPVSNKEGFCQIVLSLKTRTQCEDLLGIICSISELHALEERYQIAKLVFRGNSNSEIIAMTDKSYATIKKIRDIVENKNSVIYSLFLKLQKGSNDEVNTRESVKELSENSNSEGSSLTNKNIQAENEGPGVEERYLNAIEKLTATNTVVRAIDIANYLGVTKPSVSYALKRLRANNLISEDGSRFIALTEKGLIALSKEKKGNDLDDYMTNTDLSYASKKYVKAIQDLLNDSTVVRAIDVSNYLSVSKASVSIALKELIKKGYVEKDEKGFLSLTNKAHEKTNTLKQEAERKAEEERRRQEAERKAEEERQRQEAERKAEEERQRQEAERKAEEERQRQEAERKAEEERQRQEAERKAEEERQRQEAERKAEEERQRQEAERKAEEEHQRQEAERKAEEERQRQEAERKAEEERQRQEAERKAEEERQRQEAERKAEEERQRQEAERKAEEEHQRQEVEREAEEERQRQKAERRVEDSQSKTITERNTYDPTKSFAENFGIDLSVYEKESIRSFGMPVRLENALMNNRCRTVADFLRLSEERLSDFRNVGKGSIDEAKKIAVSLTNHKYKKENNSEKATEKELPSILGVYKQEIFSGNFDIIRTCGIGKDDSRVIDVVEEAYNGLGEELVTACKDHPDQMIRVYNLFYNYYKQYDTVLEKRERLTNIYYNLPVERRKIKLAGLVEAFTFDDSVRERLLSDMKANATLWDFYLSSKEKVLDDESFKDAIHFLNWCGFDLEAEIKDVSLAFKKDSRSYEVLGLRAKKKTLDQIGKQYGVTRERIRQIEAKAKRLFGIRVRRYNIITKIYAVRDQDVVLTPVELKEYFKEDTAIFLYLLKSVENAGYIYDATFDVFYCENISLAESVTGYLETLPDSFNTKELHKIIERGIEEFELTEEIIKKAISEQYKQTGDLLHRYRLRRSDIYIDILKKYYPSGLHIYDNNELHRFRENVVKEYGPIDLPKEDRALEAGITHVSILCGRGMYKAKENEYLPQEVLNRIEKAIDKSNSKIFLMNTIFEMFQYELLEYGIDNKYYLQGVLKEAFGDKYIFRRDYLSKDDNITSLYGDIVEFIKSSDYPVLKEEIYRRYPGITDIVITLAVADPNVLNFFGEYLHGTKLRYSEQEKRRMYRYLQTELKNNNGYAYGNDIFNYFKEEFNDFLSRNAINLPYSLLSSLGYMFSSHFEIKRPFIAFEGVDVDRPVERMREFIFNAKIHSVSETFEFAEEVHFRINSFLEFISQYDDDFLMINNKQFAAYDYIGITPKIIKIVCDEVDKEVNGTIPISSLACIHRFPNINIPWNEWLVYSIIRRWSTTLTVGTSSNQLRLSVPVVAGKGELRLEDVKNLKPVGDGTLAKTDNLDEIDSLIEDFIEDEIEF